MTKDRVVKALRAAADALAPAQPAKPNKVKASGGGQVFIGLVIAPAVGAWIDVPTDEDSLQEAIDAVLVKARKEEPGAEEWMVADYDDFPNLGEHPKVADLAKVAELLDDHDKEIVEAALSEEGGDVDDAADLLEEGYAVYDSETEYAEQYVDDIGMKNINNKENYVDLKQLARDLMMDGSLVYVNGAPYVFWN